MNVVLVGGTVEALVLAHHLSSDHTVFLVEIEAELGLPVTHPGRIYDRSILKEYITKEQESFLLLTKNPQGWGCRWDWLLKHLAANVARNGVNCYTRTRILSCSKQGEQYSLELTSGERDLPTHLIADRVIVMQRAENIHPGRRHHRLVPDQPEIFPQEDGVEWKGGTLLTADAKAAPHTDLHLNRGDGMTELWWKGDLTWYPSRGFFESSTTVLHANSDELAFDSVVARVLSFLNDPV